MKMRLSPLMQRVLRFCAVSPDSRRYRIPGRGARRATFEALQRRGLVEIPSRFGKCWGVTPAGIAVLAEEVS